MDKQQILDLIKNKIEDGTINKKDLLNSLAEGKAQKSKAEVGEKLIHTLYLIGSLITLVGIILLLSNNWNTIGFGGRIISTLGIFVVSYLVGLLTAKEEKKVLSQISFTISAVLAPLAIYVLLREINFNPDLNTYIISSLVLGIFYGITQYFIRNRVLIVITTIFITVLYVTLILKIFLIGSLYDVAWILKLASIALGIAYYFIAYGYVNLIERGRGITDSEESAVARFFYGIGSLAILIPFMTYAGIWDFLNFFIFIGVIYLGFIIKSKLIFFIASLALVYHLVSFTWKYFQGSISWPILLILIGGLIVGISYSSIKVSKRML